MLIPSTTQVLKPYLNLDFIKGDAMERGAARHAAYAAYLLGTWAPPVWPEDEGSLESFKRWADRHVMKTLAVEIQLKDEINGYTGTIDFIGECPLLNNGPVVLDWKPSSAKGPIIRAQVAAYSHLVRKAGFLAHKAGFLRMNPEGRSPKMEWVETDGLDFAGFLHALNAYRYFHS